MTTRPLFALEGGRDPRNPLPRRQYCPALVNMNTSTWDAAIAAYKVWLRLATRSDDTVYQRIYRVRTLARDLGGTPWTVTPDDLTGWLASHHWQPETLRTAQYAISKFFAWAVQCGRIDKSPADGLPVAKRAQHIPRPAPDHIVTEAVNQADRRTALMVCLGRRCGLRRGEISRIHTDDLAYEADGLWLTVHGKGDKDRLMPISDKATVDLIERWLDGRQGWLFPGLIGGHLSPARVGELMSEAMSGPWTAHTLRHRYATEVYQGTRDVLVTQKLLGHASPATTQVYVQVGRDVLRAAAGWAS